MSKRAADIVISTPASKVRRRLNFGSPYTSRAAVPTVRLPKSPMWANRPMNRKPIMYRMYRSPDVPRGCEGPCKVQSFDSIHDVFHMGKVMCILDVTHGTGLTPIVGKRFCVESVYVLGKNWMDEIIKSWNITNNVKFFLVRTRRPVDKPHDLGEVFNVFDNEPTTATVKNVHRDRYQALRKCDATVTGWQYGAKEQALIVNFFRVNHYVVYHHQYAGKYENHSENALMLYMAGTHASNPVYATLKIRIYFYDSVTN
ncbi:coat protein [Eclipta yellow vein virus]|uniref:Capsid protein n=1 Tax=Eclipta yellow vein virus TaxID=875324 RepID=A0A0M5I0G0_9GEMI|nr:coat protein [Eclipta yellow vein virus]ALB26324.1 coat protein [Eclipta yellow vein virus]